MQQEFRPWITSCKTTSTQQLHTHTQRTRLLCTTSGPAKGRLTLVSTHVREQRCIRWLVYETFEESFWGQNRFFDKSAQWNLGGKEPLLVNLANARGEQSHARGSNKRSWFFVQSSFVHGRQGERAVARDEPRAKENLGDTVAPHGLRVDRCVLSAVWGARFEMQLHLTAAQVSPV